MSNELFMNGTVFYDKLYDFLNKNHTIYIQKHSLM